MAGWQDGVQSNTRCGGAAAAVVTWCMEQGRPTLHQANLLSAHRAPQGHKGLQGINRGA